MAWLQESQQGKLTDTRCWSYAFGYQWVAVSGPASLVSPQQLNMESEQRHLHKQCREKIISFLSTIFQLLQDVFQQNKGRMHGRDPTGEMTQRSRWRTHSLGRRSLIHVRREALHTNPPLYLPPAATTRCRHPLLPPPPAALSTPGRPSLGSSLPILTPVSAKDHHLSAQKCPALIYS